MEAKPAKPNLALDQCPNNSSPCVLVVEDDAHLLRLNAKALAHRGYQVDTAEDGAIAWEALKHHGYDLLITDHDMPKLSGVELIENVQLAHIGLPVILVSGRMPTEELNRRPWLHIEATLLKPYTIAQFLGTVEAVLAANKAPQEQQQIPGRQPNGDKRQPPWMGEQPVGKTMAEYWHAPQH
jgi:DNA-binding response OmpR family regulator